MVIRKSIEWLPHPFWVCLLLVILHSWLQEPFSISLFLVGGCSFLSFLPSCVQFYLEWIKTLHSISVECLCHFKCGTLLHISSTDLPSRISPIMMSPSSIGLALERKVCHSVHSNILLTSWVTLVFEEMHTPYASEKEICVQKFRSGYQQCMIFPSVSFSMIGNYAKSHLTCYTGIAKPHGHKDATSGWSHSGNFRFSLSQ